MWKYFKCAFLSLVLSSLLAGCSNDLLPEGEGNGVSGRLYEVELLFNMGGANGENGPLSLPTGVVMASPRPLISSNNWQNVNDLRIYTFKRDITGDFLYYRPANSRGERVDYFSVEIAAGNMHIYRITPLLDEGVYRFLVIARDDKGAAKRLLSDPNLADLPFGWEAWSEGVTTLNEVTLLCTNRNVVASTEFFTGLSAQTAVTPSARSFLQRVELKRAVAGLLLYVENIPETITESIETGTGIIPRSGKTVALGIVHGGSISDRVSLFDRAALEGHLATAENGSIVHSLLRVEIPQDAQTERGYYVNLSPENSKYPNSLLCGSFVMPQSANPAGGSDTDLMRLQKSLYLLLYGEYVTADGKKSEIVKAIPIKLRTDALVSEGYDPYYYPILANHLYPLGKRKFSDNGDSLVEDLPLDLKLHFDEKAELVIQLDPFWNEYYGGNIGEPFPGVGLDPEWGEHPGGNL